jgi:hypothetical protein
MGNIIKLYSVPVYAYDIINKEYHKIPKAVKDNKSLQIFIKGHYKIPFGSYDFIGYSKFGHTIHFKVLQNNDIINDNQENVKILKENIIWLFDNPDFVCTYGAPKGLIKEGLVVVVFKKDYNEVYHKIKEYYPDLYYKRIPIYIICI